MMIIIINIIRTIKKSEHNNCHTHIHTHAHLARIGDGKASLLRSYTMQQQWCQKKGTIPKNCTKQFAKMILTV